MTNKSPIAVKPIGSAEKAISGPAKVLRDEVLNLYTNSLAQYLPNDELFAAKFVKDSNLRSLLKGLALRIIQGDQYINELLEEYLPDNTNKFLDEWEFVLGIPDSCFSGQGSNLERRTAILVKLASMGIQTANDFINLASKFGLTVGVYAGEDVFNNPSIAPGVNFRDRKESRYSIVVTYDVTQGYDFTYIYPIPFGSSEISLLTCLFNKTKPANCQVIFEKV